MMTEMEMVTLKNGMVETRVLVSTTMFVLGELFEKEPIQLYELVQKCRNSAHKMFGNTAQALADLSLVGPGPEHRVHDSIRNIVLSASEGKGALDLTIVSPIAPQGE